MKEAAAATFRLAALFEVCCNLDIEHSPGGTHICLAGRECRFSYALSLSRIPRHPLLVKLAVTSENIITCSVYAAEVPSIFARH